MSFVSGGRVDPGKGGGSRPPASVGAARWPCLPGTWLRGWVELHRSARTQRLARHRGRCIARFERNRWAHVFLARLSRETPLEPGFAWWTDLELSLRPLEELRAWLGRW